MSTLLIFGLGYSGRAVMDMAVDFDGAATSRSADLLATARPTHATQRAIGSTPTEREAQAMRKESNDAAATARPVTLIPFDAAAAAIAAASHILVTVPPDPGAIQC